MGFDADTDRTEARHVSDNTPKAHIEELAGSTGTDDMPRLGVDNVNNDHSNTDLPDQQTVGETETVKTSCGDRDIRKSDRIRWASGRFHYPQLGKPLISFAQGFLDSFNQAL